MRTKLRQRYTHRISRVKLKIRRVSFLWDTVTRMKKQEDVIRGRRLRLLRVKNKKTLEEVARHLGVTAGSIKHHENGTRGTTTDVILAYANLYGVPVDFIIDGGAGGGSRPQDGVTTIPVYGEAAGGVWRAGEDMPLDDKFAYSVSAVATFPVDAQYSRKVIGNSVSRHVRDGEYGIFVHFDRFPGGVRKGHVVDVQRVRAGLREHTVKVYHNKSTLVGDSADGEGGEMLPLANGEDDEEVRIMGILVGVYRPISY